MQIALDDRLILVTGAGRGVGRALAEGLAANGATVVCTDVNAEQADTAAREITARLGGDRAVAMELDVADEAQVGKVVREIDQRWGRIDALINNAGWIPPVARVIDTDLEMLRMVIDINLIGCFLTTKHVAPVMVRNGGGRIVYMSSMIGVQANAGQSAYGATKAGVTLLANVVHRELADAGVRTVALAPGLTDTPGMRASVDDDYIAAVAGKYPGGRLGQPEDVVSFVSFLCSDAAQHLSGTLVPIRPVTG